MTPQFKTFLAIILACACFTLAKRAGADTLVTPYLSLGMGYRDCNLTDRMICDNDAMGSNVPGYILAGLRFEPDRPRWYHLYADEIDAGWRHQSYVNRGWLIPGVLDFGGKEAQFDAYAVLWTWKFKSLSFRLPL